MEEKVSLLVLGQRLQLSSNSRCVRTKIYLIEQAVETSERELQIYFAWCTRYRLGTTSEAWPYALLFGGHSWTFVDFPAYSHHPSLALLCVYVCTCVCVCERECVCVCHDDILADDFSAPPLALWLTLFFGVCSGVSDFCCRRSLGSVAGAEGCRTSSQRALRVLEESNSGSFPVLVRHIFVSHRDILRRTRQIAKLATTTHASSRVQAMNIYGWSKERERNKSCGKI